MSALGAVVGTTLTQTPSGKTISGASNTLTNLPGANVTGTVPIGSLPTGATSTTLSTGDRGMPTGGATGDVLTKSSGTNYAVGWVTKPTTPAPVHTANNDGGGLFERGHGDTGNLDDHAA